MKKLERNEMKNLNGGLYASPPGSICTFTMTGTNGRGFCDYWIQCTGGYDGPAQQTWCDASCFSDCNTMGCSTTRMWGPVP